MKHLRTFESQKDKIFEKDDIIVRRSYNQSNLYLSLEDSYKSNITISVFYIGYICLNNVGRNEANFIFNTKNAIKTHIINNDNYDILNDKEKNIVFSGIRDYNEKFGKYLNIIKNKTDVDLRELPEYKRWILKNDMSMYNL